MWNNLGAAPKATVREVTVIGPGYGESIVVHLGDTSWLVVDSCVDPASGDSSAALKYLTMLGVDVAQAVKPVSYTHLRAHETVLDLVCRLLLEKKNTRTS